MGAPASLRDHGLRVGDLEPGPGNAITDVAGVRVGHVTIGLPVVWSDAHRLHVPEGEVWVGVRIRARSCPSGPSGIRAALEEAGRPWLRPRRSPTRRSTPCTTRR